MISIVWHIAAILTRRILVLEACDETAHSISGIGHKKIEFGDPMM